MARPSHCRSASPAYGAVVPARHSRRRGERSPLRALCLAAAASLLLTAVVFAQQTPVRLTPTTQVGTIGFRFTDTRTFRDEELLPRIALTARGSMVGLRDALDFIPFVEPVGEHPLDPLELQRDVVRLRRFYGQAGFIHADIGYDVTQDPEDDVIDVTFVINEGPPLRLRSVRVTGPDGRSPPSLPAEIAGEWEDALRSTLPKQGERLDLFALPSVQRGVNEFLMNHGYPGATVTADIAMDSAANEADLAIRATPGERQLIGPITVSGAESVGDDIILRELPFVTGDTYSFRKITEGRREILSLGLFRRAAVGIADSGAVAGSVPIHVDLTESPLRQIGGDAGYDSRGGLTMQAEWLHRNFTGDARTFSISALAQTGILSFEDIPEILYRGAFSLTQPYVFHRRLSLVISPFIEYRDDYRDQSAAYGLTTTLVYQVDAITSLALRYTIGDRRIQEARYGEYTSGTIDFLTLLNTLAKGDRVLKSAIGAQASFGDLDDITVPHRGYLLRPSTEVTVIPSINSIEYWTLNLPLYGFYPLSDDVGLAGRVIVGSIFPFGKGLPSGDETVALKFLQLRDIVFTAGGSEDVRGWGSRLLGPKFPDIRVDTMTEQDTTYTVSGYIPVGGLNRMSFSAEVRFPFPGLGRSARISVYLDGARIWNARPPFKDDIGWSDEDRFFFGTGLGILYLLPIGTFRLDTGYKLNPSYQDLRDAGEVFRAAEAGLEPESVPADQMKRFHVHFSVSVSF